MTFPPQRFRRSPTLSPGDLAAALLEQLPDAVVSCNADGTTVFFNRKARELTRLPAGPVRDVELQSRSDLGPRYVASVSGGPLRDRHGEIQGAVR